MNRPEILVNETDNKNNTALIWATSKNNFQLVQLLLNRPEILVNETDRNGFTALIWASEK
ncbi:ankyrin repeat domain-containing protein [bacterium]|nr:ankyrin repeat domain-containing protein [bacterium]